MHEMKSPSPTAVSKGHLQLVGEGQDGEILKSKPALRHTSINKQRSSEVCPTSPGEAVLLAVPVVACCWVTPMSVPQPRISGQQQQ